ncbi:hypothetical protein ABFX02_04G206400 [Erythranthe guttata]
MRDFASCFSEYAVQVSDTSCSSYSSNSCISPNSIPSVQNSVTCLYRAALSTKRHVLITLTWCKNSLSQGLNITFSGDDPTATTTTAAATFKLNTNSRLFRKLKGSKSIEFHNTNIEIFWDLYAARYESGPEPVEGYYILITFDSDLVFSLGDTAHEAHPRKLRPNPTRTAKSSLISRQEHFSGNTLYSTRTRFCENGSAHDIVIHCSGENDGLKYPILSVSIDKKTVIRVKRLQWNFRGNQTIFLDGLLVDLMWDVFDWFYNPGGAPGNAVFMFRTRSGLDSRLWLEEKMVQKDLDKVDFSFIIYACKNL